MHLESWCNAYRVGDDAAQAIQLFRHAKRTCLKFLEHHPDVSRMSNLSWGFQLNLFHRVLDSKRFVQVVNPVLLAAASSNWVYVFSQGIGARELMRFIAHHPDTSNQHGSQRSQHVTFDHGNQNSVHQ